MTTPERVIERISLYRRLLDSLKGEGQATIFSHELAGLARGTATQVRRDMMTIGVTGSPAHGYRAQDLIDAIGLYLDSPEPEGVALVGIGNLGRAIMAFFQGRRPNLRIVAAFDVSPEKVGRVIHGCRCHPLDDLERVVREEGIRVGVVAVPASAAQDVADRLVRGGVRGLVNLAPVRLHVPPGVHTTHVDITMSLEKAAYFARQRAGRKEGEP